MENYKYYWISKGLAKLFPCYSSMQKSSWGKEKAPGDSTQGSVIPVIQNWSP